MTDILQDAHNWIYLGLLVFIVILWRAKVPGLLAKTLDDAGARVQAQLDEARRLREEAEALLADIKIRRHQSEAVAAELMAAAEAEAERLRAEAAVQLEEDIRRRAALAERKIAQAEAQAASEVKAAAAELAAQATEAVLAARVSGAANDPLIDASLPSLARRFSS